MKTMLHMSTHLRLPLEAVTDTFAILAVRGVGKTHTASVMAEEMLKAGQPIVAYDPTGAWWGLKSSADGKRPGFPVVVFGGEHADVPLEETAGATVAATIVDKRIPAILDCSLMRKASRIRFMTDFCETLYHRNREALHLFLDEAHSVAPQNIRAIPEATRLLGAVEDIVLQGRRRGLGLTAISQRPALLNTNIRSMCTTLVAMRIMGKHDRKAIDEWIEAHGDPATAQAMLVDLASLPKGDGWVWNAPANIFKRVHFRERETFDSSATPKVGGKPVTPQRMAEIDLDALGAAIKATVEKAKADDPKELRRRIAQLERDLAAKPKAEMDQAAVDRAVTSAVAQRDKQWKSVIADRERIIDFYDRRMTRIRPLVEINGEAEPKVDIPSGVVISQTDAPPKVARHDPERPVKTDASYARNDTRLPKGEHHILRAIAQYPDGVGREMLTVLTGYKRSSRDTYIQRLRERRLIDLEHDKIVATPDGTRALGSDFEPLPTGHALQTYWLSRLPSGEREVLTVLIGRYPDSVERSDIDEATGYKRSSRDTYIQRLRSRQLVEVVGQGHVRATQVLFEE
jgi:uncharacterized protein